MEQLEAALAPVLHPEQAIAPTPPAAPVDFLELMDRWIDEYRRKLHPRTYRPTSEKTIAGLKATRSRFAQFAEAKQYPLTLEGMNLDFYNEFRTYLMDELSQGLNTFGKHISRLSTFLAWCEEQELPVHRQYRKFVAPSQYVGAEALTEHELRRIRDLDFRSGEVQARLLALRGERREKGNTPGQWSYQQWAAHVELARDKFLECCYTGLRISDAERLSWHHVKGQMIHIKSEKTGGECYIPFYDDDVFRMVSLAQHYEHRTHGDLLLPICYRVNEFLKVVQQLAGLTRLNLTTKLGRKTFATLKLYQGVPTRLVMQATGHTTEKAFNHYVGVDTIKLLQEFVRKSPGMRRSA
ncbi:tyrosine-type recombinase/integrase [Hymenobacter sp. NBH84]|uniref:tyrosine-type recombinase/integrase n=1 Tax=Hymenobacter sp. NBH84 TaxID=2596915 RepID=UPI001628AF05|nr:tyrosine-type recombinase/integrase [Hymenobacter sp. NBH84]